MRLVATKMCFQFSSELFVAELLYSLGGDEEFS